MVILAGGAVSYGRGTPVAFRQVFLGGTPAFPPEERSV